MQILLIIGVIVGALIVVLAINAGYVLSQVPRYSSYWEKRSKEPVAQNAVYMTVIGDSVAQAIGAQSPAQGVVGRTEAFIKKNTDRPVYINNVSKVGGKVKDVLDNQLDRVDFDRSDVVIVLVSANDVLKNTPLDQYEQRIDTLLSKLPASKTVMANVPAVNNREPYQQILEKAASKYGIPLADVVTQVLVAMKTQHLTAGDFFHPNSAGYGYWFEGFEPHLKSLLPKLRSS